MEAFEFGIDRCGDHAVLRAFGEVDLATAEAWRAALATLIETGDTLLRVDLRHVSYIGAGGIRALVAAHDEAARHGATLIVTAASPLFIHLCELLDLHQLLDPNATDAS